MSYTAYFYLEAVCGLLDRWNVLFFGRIHSVRHKELHGLPAADQLTRTAMHYLNNVATDLALINLQLFCHY